MTLIRSIIYVVWLYLSGIILGIIALPTLLMPRRALVWFIKLYSRGVLWGLRFFCGVRVILRGKKHVSAGPALVAGKHQAMLDIFIPFLILDDPIMVMKRELLWYPVLGWCALKARMMPIDRHGGAKTMKLMLTKAQKWVPEGRGRQMVIYPEGTRMAPGAPPDYKPAGVRAFYKALNVPMLPLATNAGQCWPAHGIKRTPGTIIYEVLPPIEPGLQGKAVMKRLEDELEAGCAHLNNEGGPGKYPKA